MQKPVLNKILSFLFIIISSLTLTIIFSANKGIAKVATIKAAPVTNLFSTLNLQEKGLSQQAFDYALQGYNALLAAGKLKNDSVISIIDFGLTSNKKRLFVIDLKNHNLLFNTYVSHGKNSGLEEARSFSNDIDSYKSSLGFYITADTYKGKHGYSLKLEGEEKGINDNALSRGIVMHAADYVNESFIQKRGFIGRSQGCPALPENIYKDVITKIKDGSCLFIYSPDQYYISHSDILKPARTA
jgi:hypothetical protein